MNSKFTPESYTPLEVQRIEELSNKLSDLKLTNERLHPAELIRWLRARSLNVEKANEMLRKHMEWRKMNGIDGLLEREKLHEDFERIFPMGYVGVDNEGYPILIAPSGRRDFRPLFAKWGLDKCLDSFIILSEMIAAYLRKVSEEQGRPVTQIVQIVDMEGFNYGQFTSKLCIDFTIKNLTTYNFNYPEMLRYAMVINAPKAFHIIWNLLKSFIPKKTQDKIEVFGTDKEKWMKAITEKFPKVDLPPHWGGNRQGDDEYCSTDDKLWVVGTISRTFFNFNKPYPNEEDDNTSHLIMKTIGARDSLKIRLSLTSPSSIISWRFRTDSCDIGFQIVDADGNEVVSYRKVKCQKQFEEGEQKCHRLGIHTVIFDNSYSWTRSKTVSYNVSVIGVLEEEVENKLEL